MGIVEARGVTHRYGRRDALRGVDLEVPEGALYALLGPNGAGKTTLLQILMGIRRPTSGSVALFGKDASRLAVEERGAVAYVAEGQRLPGWMTLRQLEAYLAPLYAGWDSSLAADLRRRFGLDADQKIRTLSRGQQMKAAVLCALAPRPRLLLLDEPFTGMDVMVKDDLVRGLLASAGEGCTVVITSHDIGELEALADWVGFLDSGRLALSEPMDTLRERLKRVDVVTRNGAEPQPAAFPAEWLSVERSGPRISFLLSGTHGAGDAGDNLRRWFPEPARIEVREASLREIFVALARGNAEMPTEEVA